MSSIEIILSKVNTLQGLVIIKTRDRILYKAIELFNDLGTGKVSTNHIATAADISPGNLYYHFQNKEAIIRAILEMMFDDWGQLWKLDLDHVHTPTIDHIKNLIIDSFQLQWKYRFFYRELIVLSRNDPILRDTHQQMQHNRLIQHENLFQLLIQLGVFRQDSTKEELQKTLTICWVFSNYWISFIEGAGLQANDEEFEKGVEHIIFLLTPYFSNDIKRNK